jgi:predicted enzyme related to lactoylglutathione lyase
MAKVLGLGGLFLKARDPEALGRWYRDVLGLEMHGTFAMLPPEPMAAHAGALTVFNIEHADTTYFEPSTKAFMLNFAVDDLDGMLARCATHGVEPVKRVDESNGRFAHILDPEGTKIELWQPTSS